MRNGLAVLVFLTLPGGLMGATSTEGGRLEWETRSAPPVWHRSCAFSHQGDSQNPDHRFAVIHASLKSLARGDAVLYAVFLKSDDDLKALAQVLKSSGWLRDPALDDVLTREWLPLKANGHITVYADEAHQPGKNWVVVINGEGEILGVRTLWSRDGDLALWTRDHTPSTDTPR